MASRPRSAQDTVHPRGTLPAPVGLAGHWLQPVLTPVTSARASRPHKGPALALGPALGRSRVLRSLPANVKTIRGAEPEAMNLGGDLHCSQEGSQEPPLTDSEVPAWKAARLRN